ncbi:MAG: Holliday junction resolvase RuvX [Candidatus Taylorbacteria bacterium]|nr:Holliday junction resolvase RuvX [Candidatus Taylorbacteria bacterium]
MTKYLGIDYGEKRVGVAVSDNEATVAFPKVVFENDQDLIKKIVEFCIENEVGAIVIGESKNNKGEDNKINPKIIVFKRELGNAIKVPIFLEPEFMTSLQVENTFGKTDMLDASAASIILQTYMDKERNRQEIKKKSEEEKKNMKKDLETSPASMITYADFKKVQMKVGKILTVEQVPGSEKLLKLSVSFGPKNPTDGALESQDIRQIVSGIAFYFPNNQVLVGKKVAFVTNLEPRPLMGLMSNGMILAVKNDDNLAIMEVPDFIKEGTELS